MGLPCISESAAVSVTGSGLLAQATYNGYFLPEISAAMCDDHPQLIKTLHLTSDHPDNFIETSLPQPAKVPWNMRATGEVSTVYPTILL